jgi:AhpD family alkylhydroperoxidase
MEARMKNPAMILTDAMAPLQALNQAIDGAGVPAKLLGLVHLRTSQLNGCSVCVDMHRHHSHGETPERLFAVAAWRDTPYFTDAERAVLALTESVTRLGEAGVPDDVWAAAAKHFDERALAAIVLQIALVNVWNPAQRRDPPDRRREVMVTRSARRAIAIARPASPKLAIRTA